MNNRKVAEIFLDVKSGHVVPRKTIQMAIGYLENTKQTQKNRQKFVEVNEIQKVIDFLKAKSK